MNLDQQQQDAISKACAFVESPDPGVFYIAGPAGTGKTTIAKEIAARVGVVAFGAYTGKAASVLARKGCTGATTVHRLLYRSQRKSEARLADLQKALHQAEQELEEAVRTRPDADLSELHSAVRMGRIKVAAEVRSAGRPNFALQPSDEVLEARAVLIDEVSMIGDRMGADVLSVCKKVIVTGDPYQLPPIGEGGYFTNRKPDVMLEKIHRQGSDSPILQLATDLRRGRGYRLGDYGPGCRVITRKDERCEALCMAADQMIVGTNATRDAANRKHRQLANRQGDMPVVGDRVICLRNNHTLGLMNGTLWKVASVDGFSDDNLRVDMVVESVDEPDAAPIPVQAWTSPFRGGESRVPPFSGRSDPEGFGYSYAITCHKSQGSEFSRGYVLDQSGVFARDRAKWLYTAVTRFRDDLTLVVP